MPGTTWSGTDKTAAITLGGTNNLAATIGSGVQWARTLDKQISGKYYVEYTWTTLALSPTCGFSNASPVLASANALGVAGMAVVVNNGAFNINGNQVVSIGNFGTAGMVVCFALDLGAQQIWARNGAAGNWNNNASANPATGVGGLAAPFGGGIPVYGVVGSNNANGSVVTANFGDQAFTGAVPAGFTSGLPSGAAPAVNAVATQLGLEEWAHGSAPQALLTQIAIEEWGSTTTGVTQALMTQIAIEEWAQVVQAAAAARQAMVMVMA